MELESSQHLGHCKPQQSISRVLTSGRHDFHQQCLRILRCTAHAMANSPGGLRFVAGTRPWLDGLGGGRPLPAAHDDLALSCD